MRPDEMEIPKAPTNYLKLDKQGTYKVRILSDFIEGYKDRIEAEKKSVFYRKEDCPEKAVNPKGFIYFWNCIIRSYDEKRIMSFAIMSKAIMNKIKDLCADADWGKELDYDLKITRKGEGKETKYEVIPAGKGELTDEIAQAYVDADVEQEKLFEGVDLFKK